MKVKTSRDIGALIHAQRNRLALTQGELATRVGVSRPWIVQLEKGKPTAQMNLVLRTLKELGLTLDVLTSSSKASRRSGTTSVDLDRIIRRTLSTKSLPDFA